MSDPVYLEGAISVKAALECDSRPMAEILAEESRDDRDFRYIEHLARQKGVPVRRVPREQIEALTEGTSHGGILAKAGPRRTVELKALLSVPSPFLVLLEGIEDPYNFGGALRALYAAGATGLILPKRNWLSAAGTVARASAGASERLPVTEAEDLSSLLPVVRGANIPVVCAQRKDAVSIYQTALPRPLLLAVGGEMRGLSRKVTDQADKNIYIPYGSDFRNSLSAASACAVIAFEILRQNTKKPTGCK